MSSPHSAIDQNSPTANSEAQLTMYDLPSESSEDAGLPDFFHYLQPQLLSATFRLTDYVADQIFTAGDLNVYYDVEHPLWHKRPDWFAVVGVPKLYKNRDLRLSYVIWQEHVSPSVVVELLSPGTADEDLGQTRSVPDHPPTKWHVYEQLLRVPYYVVFDRYTDHLRVFALTEGHYALMAEFEMASALAQPSEAKIWLPSLHIGIGLWHGTYDNITRYWLRWYDASGQWILTDAEQAQERGDRLAARLRELGIDPDEV